MKVFIRKNENNQVIHLAKAKHHEDDIEVTYNGTWEEAMNDYEFLFVVGNEVKPNENFKQSLIQKEQLNEELQEINDWFGSNNYIMEELMLGTKDLEDADVQEYKQTRAAKTARKKDIESLLAAQEV